MLGGLLSSTGLSDLGDFGDMASGSGNSAQELALFEIIVMSREVVEGAIVKFNIIEEENFKFMYDAVKYFRENIVVISKDKVAGTMSIGTYDPDPNKAKEMTDYLIYELNKKNIELNIENAKNNRLFIQGRHDLVKQDLTRAEDSLKSYQDKYGIAPDLQVQLSTKGSFEIESEIKSEEVKLDVLRKILSEDQPEIKTQLEKIAALKKVQLEMINSDYTSNSLNLKGSPGVIMNYFRLRREVEIQNKILVTIIPMLEQSRIEENKETPTILVIDNPNVPDKKAKPKRLYIVAGFTFAAFFISYAYFFLKTHFRKPLDV